jgi:hypothetical protein
VKEDVFRFEVAVDDVVYVHVLNCLANLPDVLSDHFLRHLTGFLQVLVKILSQTGLEHKTGTFLIDEEVIEFDDVGVVDKTLNFDFSYELV